MECPECGSMDTDYNDTEDNYCDDSVDTDFYCNDCGCVWLEKVYRETKIEIIEHGSEYKDI